ncbi:MAG: hypothetical protein ACLQSR_17480 [Limisphaerales bacterium]
MKRPIKQLLDDLLEDSAPQEFRAALMDKTLRGARRRKRARHFKLAMGAAALAGIFAFAFQEMREPAVSLNQIRRPILNATPAQALNSVQVVSTKLDSFKNVTVSDSSASTLTVVQTGEADKPKEINDKELLALVADKPVALIHQGLHQSELVFLDPKDKNGLPDQQ